jgi:hypothetical protein
MLAIDEAPYIHTSPAVLRSLQPVRSCLLSLWPLPAAGGRQRPTCKNDCYVATR